MKLLNSLSAAFVALDSLNSQGVNECEIDQDAINIKAAHTERTFSIALDSLAELIDVAVSVNKAPDKGRILQLFDFAFKLELLVNGLRQLSVGLSKGKGEVGDGIGKLRVIELFADFMDRLCSVNGVRDGGVSDTGGSEIGHTKYSLIIELVRQGQKARRLKVDRAAREDFGSNEWYLGLAEALIMNELPRPSGLSRSLSQKEPSSEKIHFCNP